MAMRPIPCYKIMSVNKDGTFASALYGFEYTLGFTYRLDDNDFNSFPERNPSRWILKIEKGFHSYQRENTAKFELLNYGSGNWAIVKCEIPKGARYWPGDHGMAFCSDSIKPVKWKKAGEVAWHDVPPAPACQ